MSTMLVCCYGSVVQFEIQYYVIYSIAFFCLGLFLAIWDFILPYGFGNHFSKGVKNEIGDLVIALTL